MPHADVPGDSRFKTSLMHLLLTWTPLRFRVVHERALGVAHSLRRADRRRRERRGDWSRSTPALFGMDVRLGTLLGRDGTFVEAGGNDGFTQSNTYYLERALGWTGVLVEPVPSLARLAEANRPDSRVVCAALTDPAGSGQTLRMHFAGLMSIISGARGDERSDQEWTDKYFEGNPGGRYAFDVPGITLSEVLDAAGVGEIDLLSLDLEGYEPSALAGLDWDRHAPRWLLVEAHDDQARETITAILGDRYVLAGRFSEMDDLYHRADVVAPALDAVTERTDAAADDDAAGGAEAARFQRAGAAEPPR
ncbi:MAG TPA: FkbM family methyltransferase [Baekduia sp.]|uniref:FkbM family methyltransferase n=1 Tax=Baekduia sp. TaxID=2600305 RepID=UPI002D775941|nr:FkbM family methyltransferase [Baekduia sp.]HET6507337.1 FkbM family methyltransferase [Baekduia sp.]